MTVHCGINGEGLGEHQIFLCHHCGMPVCEEHGRVVAADDAFAGAQAAMHCRTCADRFHKGAAARQSWSGPLIPGRYAGRAARP
ncbi:hypothetical protein [Symbioplanes lichenis]|uniref:hypothetical protein n=1 Tax=Symbioplanes lichenis TaxID=1629072 RepID=UPI002738D46D|nr:hypothetical protein [Actinoplanes lichenis]